MGGEEGEVEDEEDEAVFTAIVGKGESGDTVGDSEEKRSAKL